IFRVTNRRDMRAEEPRQLYARRSERPGRTIDGDPLDHPNVGRLQVLQSDHRSITKRRYLFELRAHWHPRQSCALSKAHKLGMSSKTPRGVAEHAVARLELLDRGASLLHHSGELDAEDPAPGPRQSVAEQATEPWIRFAHSVVGTRDRRCPHSDQNLIGRR